MTEGTTPACPKCRRTRTFRVKRTGLMQKFILTRLGLYPWECAVCRDIFHFTSRGLVKRQYKIKPEPQMTATVQFES